MLSSGDLEESIPPVQTPLGMLPHFWGTPHCYGSSLLGAWQIAGDAQLSLWQNTFQSILSNVLGSLRLSGPYIFICCLQVKL